MKWLTIVAPFVFAVSCFATASEPSDLTAGTSFEQKSVGNFETDAKDRSGSAGYYWASASTSDEACVTNYTGAAYDYAGHGMSRHPFLERVEAGTSRFLQLSTPTPRERLVLPRAEVADPISNLLLTTSVYADTLVRLTPCLSSPVLDASDRIVVWMRESEAGSRLVTNLMITAGRYAGGYDHVVATDYVIASPAVEAGAWCRLTIRALPDVTSVSRSGKTLGVRAPGCVVAIDGQDVVAEATSYGDLGEGFREEWLSPEARVLKEQRRLFPWIANAGEDKALTLSRLSFSGQGAVDDVVITTTQPPAYMAPEAVFTLCWDAGIVDFDCVVSNAEQVVTHTHVATGASGERRRDFALGTNVHSHVILKNVTYDEAHDYAPGTWRSEGGCALSGETFACDGSSMNPAGFVASSLAVVTVGGAGGCETLDEARARLLSTGTHTIQLGADLVITSGPASGGYNDRGRFTVTNGEDIILDLHGHTLQGRFAANPTILQTGGKLLVRDSVGGGAVRPPTGSQLAVRSYYKPASQAVKPLLVLEAGRYDGAVSVKDGSSDSTDAARCIIDGGRYTNQVEAAQGFYLEQFVTNGMAYYGVDTSNYWSVVSTTAYVWRGRGGDTRWDNPANWQCGAVPGAEDVALFPATAEHPAGWPVDFGTGVATKKFWLDADVALTGANEFSDVTVEPGKAGRFVGSGVVTFTGTLPGNLTDAASGATQMRLGTNWTGTVRIAGIDSAQVLSSITGWGNAKSKVEFNGVRGYLNDKANCALTYELVLTDSGDTPAWRNDTGYAGSVVSFPKLSGTGTFLSPKNLREVLQVFQFRDVASFTGTFRLGGKRLLLGTGTVASSSRAGHFTFSDAVSVRSGLGWTGVSAWFGPTLNVYGRINEALMSYSGAQPDVSDVAVTLRDRETGEESACCLVAEDGIVRVASSVVTIGGNPVQASSVADAVKSGTTFDVPDGSAVTIRGKDVIVNGKIVSTVANYYTVSPVAGSATSYAVQFDEAAATPVLSGVTVSQEGSSAVIRVTNAHDGLWYGIQSVTSLAEDIDQAPVHSWKQAEGDTVTLEPLAQGSSGFYRVIMTDQEPTGGVQ